MNAIHQEVIANAASAFMKAIGQEMHKLLTGFEKAVREDMQLQVSAVFGTSQPAPAQPTRRKKLDMQCRHSDGSVRCAQLSKGPRFGFLCQNHVMPMAVVAPTPNGADKPKRRGRKPKSVQQVQAQPVSPN